MQQRVRNFKEIVNKYSKQWEIIVTRHRHDVCGHAHMFRTSFFLTQLSMNNGTPLRVANVFPLVVFFCGPVDFFLNHR